MPNFQPASSGGVDIPTIIGTHHPGTLNDIQTNAMPPKPTRNQPVPPPPRVDRADARRHTAANVANLIEGSIFMDLCHCDFGQLCSWGKG